MSDHLFIPLALAEKLHVTLGPLAEVLDEEGHRWAPMAKRMVNEYVQERDNFLIAMHGHGVIPEVKRTTFQAVDEFLEKINEVIEEEEHFTQWADEVAGESESA